MANSTQTTASLLNDNHYEEKENHVEANDRTHLQDNAELEYVKSSNVIRLCAFIVARPKFAFGELVRISYVLYGFFLNI